MTSNIPTAQISPSGDPVDLHYVVGGIVQRRLLVELTKPGVPVTPVFNDAIPSSGSVRIPGAPDALVGFFLAAEATLTPISGTTLTSFSIAAFQGTTRIGTATTGPHLLTAGEKLTLWLHFVL